MIKDVVFSSASNTGSWGEQVAADYLAAKGYRILVRNWRDPRDLRDELDLVCQDGELMVFVEVKTRRAGAAVRGMLAVDLRKQRVLRRSIQAFLRCLHPVHRPRFYRFDLVEIEHSGPKGTETVGEVCHIENYPLFGSRWC